ncbi:MAG: 6-phosphogluconolactonase [Bryobacterales bacterium]|nr:6-phosphogluconolactonase [Bryobacterales bacterium]
MSARRYVYDAPEAAAGACAKNIANMLEGILTRAPAATLAISGGSTPRRMFEFLAGAAIDWSRVHLFWVDERAVPPSNPQSNYLTAEQALIRPAQIPPENVHRIRAELPPEEAAETYADEIRTYFHLEKDELPAFDVIHCGMGADAHTASLFPGEPLIEDGAKIAAAVYVKKLAQHRITLLPGVLRKAVRVVFLVSGEDKRAALRTVFEAPYDPREYPAQLVARGGGKGDVLWFLDRAAAGPADER